MQQLPYEVMRVLEANAIEHGFPLPRLAAVVEVESNGIIYGPGTKLPMVLFEPHLFYRRLAGAARDEAVHLGLASKVWNKKLYGKTQSARWKQIQDAMDLCKRHGLEPNIAGECASYGVGQVLGEHWDNLNYSSFAEFFNSMRSGVEGQVEVMIRFIKANGLDDELIEGRWAAFARGYNGPGYAKNKYHTKMAAAAARYGDGAPIGPDGMLRMGAHGAKVREIQALLVRAGYQLKVDGDFGPSTKKAVRAFQLANGITVDGVVGPETQKAISSLRQGVADKPGAQKATEVDGVIKGAGTAVGGTVVAEKIDAAKTSVESAIPQLEQMQGLSEWVGYGVTALTVAVAALAVAGVAWAAWAWWQSRRTVEV